MAYLNEQGLRRVWQRITEKFVAQEDGLGLSENSYTDADKDKLDGMFNIGVFARNIGDIEGEIADFDGKVDTVRQEYAEMQKALLEKGIEYKKLNTPNLLTQEYWTTNADNKRVVFGNAARHYGSTRPYVKSLSRPVETTYTEEPADKGDSSYLDESGVWHVWKDSDEIRTSVVDLAEPITESDGERYDHALQFDVTAANAWDNAERVIFNRGSDGGSYEKEVTDAETGETRTETVEYGSSGLLEMEEGQTYTLSCWAKIASGEAARLRFAYGYDGYGNEVINPNNYVYKDVSGGEWQRVYWTFVYHAETSYTPDGATSPTTTTNRKRVGIGVCRWETATVLLCGFRLTAGGLYENNTMDELMIEVAEAQARAEEMNARLLAQIPVKGTPIDPNMNMMLGGEEQLYISDAVGGVPVQEMRIYVTATADGSGWGEAKVTFGDVMDATKSVVYTIPIEALSGLRVDSAFLRIVNGTTLTVPGAAGTYELAEPLMIPAGYSAMRVSCDIGKVGLYYYQSVRLALSSLEARVKALEG